MKQTRDSIADIWGDRTPYFGDWPVRVDEHIVEEPDRWVQSACVLCSNGCGMDIGIKDGLIVGVWGRAVDAVNKGRLGPKGLHGWVANHSQDRLTKPLIRRILAKEDLFVIVQDAFRTETTDLADLVLPAAMWGEKTGTYTNVDRTVHISHKAIDPPGEARADFDIFLDYARRMNFRDKDGAPLIKWNTPEECFEAWKECTRGRPCDYTGLSYAKLTGSSGIQWPCDEQHPDGTPHLYTDGVFNTSYDYCETYGHDLETGSEVEPVEYRANDPKGKAILKAADYQPPHEEPNEEYPFWLTTGRVVYHFHTRTKTGRSKELQDAAPDAFVQLSVEDAEKYGIQEGDMVEVESRRGKVIEPAHIGDIEPGVVFIPFHYGSWDDDSRPRAANELTITEWDPVSKQPHFKYGAVRIKPHIVREHKVDSLNNVITNVAEKVVDIVDSTLNREA